MLVEKIRQICSEKGLTIQRLEQTAGLTNGCVSKWAVSDPKVSNLKKVADVLGVTVDDLLTEDEEEAEDGEKTE